MHPAAPPCCPRCEYEIGSGTLTICPECGLDLPTDPSHRVAGGWRTPWSRHRPLALWRGLPAVVFHPRRTLENANDPDRVTWARSVLFGALCAAVTIVAWAPVRTIACRIFLFFAWPAANWWNYASSATAWSHLVTWSHWLRLAKWEFLALGRWWLFFAVIAGTNQAVAALRLPHSRAQSNRSLVRRFLLFSPWFCLLELVMLLAVLIQNPAVIPEPSTVFIGKDGWLLGWTRPLWLIRGALPSGFVLFLFFRHVLRRNRTTSVVAALLLVPLALWVSIACSKLYLALIAADVL